MLFILSKLAWAVLRPSVLFLLAILIGVWLRGRLRRLLLTLGVTFYVVVLLLPVDQVVLRPLEDRFARPGPPPAQVDGILVLGGAVDEALTQDRGIPSLNQHAERMTEAVALARRYPHARVVFTGGSGRFAAPGTSEADVARMLFTELGLDPARVTYENASRNTWENAVLTRAAVAPAPGETWLLVTSAFHMPRSVGIFRRIGWAVTPWPVGYKTGRSTRTWYDATLTDRLEHVDFGVHEWVGLIAYRLLNRTDALFPSP
jgi:uncharacterized SAM-binding protein YcdF (DUF218 family)